HVTIGSGIGMGSLYMQTIRDLFEDVMAIIIIVLFVGILIGHLGLAFWVGWRTRWPQSLKVLGYLSVATGLIWLVLGFVIGFILALPSEAPSWYYIYAVSFGLPFNTIPEDVALWIPDQGTATCVYFIV